MPTYEYVCRSCGTRIDAVQAFSDPPLSICEACGGPLRRVYGTVGVVFKGSGFYKTDSRTAASAPKAKTSENGKADTASADSASKSGDGTPKSTDGAKPSAKEPAAKQ